jgi:hypothetical protein
MSAEADNNAVAVFGLAADGGRLLGRVPVGWYPLRCCCEAIRCWWPMPKGAVRLQTKADASVRSDRSVRGIR